MFADDIVICSKSSERVGEKKTLTCGGMFWKDE